MKHMIPALALALIALVAVGCNNNKKPVAGMPENRSVMDVTAPSGPSMSATPVQQVSDLPAVSAPSQTSTPTAIASTGGSHTVKRGETLFGIAKARYGNGNQYKKILAANPGVTPENLKAGQTLVLP